MRLFGIVNDNDFKEYVRMSFEVDHEEATLEAWLERNPDGILEEGTLLIIGRQVTTNLCGFIDLLALDRQGDVVVLELKRGRTPREVIAQALEYASFAERLEWTQLESILQTYTSDPSIELADYHRRYFELESDEAVAFNKSQRIVIVGQQITDPIRQTAEYLGKKGIPTTCVQFSFFEDDSGRQLMSQDIVVEGEDGKAKVSSVSSPPTTKDQFLRAVDHHGRPVFEAILDLAEKKAYPINWGTKGFSLNVQRHGATLGILYCFPPESVFKQSLYTGLVSPRGGLVGKIGGTGELAEQLFSKALETGLFVPAGGELKCLIDRPLSLAEIESLLRWVAYIAQTAGQFEHEE